MTHKPEHPSPQQDFQSLNTPMWFMLAALWTILCIYQLFRSQHLWCLYVQYCKNLIFKKM